GPPRVDNLGRRKRTRENRDVCPATLRNHLLVNDGRHKEPGSRRDALARLSGVDHRPGAYQKPVAVTLDDLLDHLHRARDGHRNLERLDAALGDGITNRDRLSLGCCPYDRQDAYLRDAQNDRVPRHRETLAVPPFMTRSTSASVAMLV